MDFGADVVLDPAAPDFAAVLGPRGAFILLGITPRPLTISEGLTFNYLCKQVRGHYGGTPKSVDELVRLASHGRLDLAPSITEHLPLADAAEAVRRLEHKIGDPIRLILVP